MPKGAKLHWNQRDAFDVVKVDLKDDLNQALISRDEAEVHE